LEFALRQGHAVRQFKSQRLPEGGIGDIGGDGEHLAGLKRTAQDYLNLGSGFSHASLVKQLTSQYGSGFSAADAEFAVSYLHPDWNAQAAEAARGYMNLGTGFSRASLIQQLTSPYGNEFTEAQAEYAASQVGL